MHPASNTLPAAQQHAISSAVEWIEVKLNDVDSM